MCSVTGFPATETMPRPALKRRLVPEVRPPEVKKEMRRAGESIPWGPGRHLVLTQPAMLAGVVVSDSAPFRPEVLGMSAGEWASFLVYQKVSLPSLVAEYQRLESGWRVVQDLEKLEAPPPAGPSAPPERAKVMERVRIQQAPDVPIVRVSYRDVVVLGRATDLPPLVE